MNRPVVLISIFRETIIGGVAVHASNLYERIAEEGLAVEKVNYATVFVARSVFRKAWLLACMMVHLLRLRLRGAKIFHFHVSNRSLVYYLFAWPLWLLGARLLLSQHSGYGYDKWLSENKGYDWVNRLFLRMVDRLIFMNPTEAEAIRCRYPFLKNRVVTINPFIAPPSAAVPGPNSVPRRTDQFRLVTIGVWMQRYNVEEAIEAAIRFQERTGITTTITVLLSTVIIEPAYQRSLQELIERARRTVTVNLLEDRNDILDILVRHDVFIRPSFLDSYGLCVAESLLVGTPAIATDVCRRCENTLLYRRGETESLHQHLLSVWERKGEKRVRLLHDEEDSFNKYREIYHDFTG